MWFPSLKTRQPQQEWMDAPDADPRELKRSLAFIRRINRLLGYTKATIFHLNEMSRSWKPGERIEIVDLATGSADIPRAILRWAAARGFDVRVTGVDWHSATIQEAAEQGADGKLKLVRANVLCLPFESNSFDYALTAMFLHHLSEAEVVQALREMNRVARRGVVVADLLRDSRAYGWISVFTTFAGPMVRHDARVSVAQAFTGPEIVSLRDAAGMGYAQYHRHFGHRFVLAGEKSGFPANSGVESAAPDAR